MNYHREEPRETTKIFILVEGHDIYGHEKLEALMTDVSYSGVCLHTQFPFELSSVVTIYLGGELVAKGEVANVITDDSDPNIHTRTRIGVQITDKYNGWPYSD